MSFFARIANIWRGFLSLWMSDVESKNPAAVYQAAIDKAIVQYSSLKSAAAGIVRLRNETESFIARKENELKEINVQLETAIDDESMEEVALLLIQKKEEVEQALASRRIELESIVRGAEETKAGLLNLQGEIEKLKREKDEMLAKKANAEARIKIQETLDGLSTDADVKALDGVRENISKLQAEADIGSELKENTLDSKLAKLRNKTAEAGARSTLEAMKNQRKAKALESERNI